MSSVRVSSSAHLVNSLGKALPPPPKSPDNLPELLLDQLKVLIEFLLLRPQNLQFFWPPDTCLLLQESPGPSKPERTPSSAWRSLWPKKFFGCRHARLRQPSGCNNMAYLDFMSPASTRMHIKFLWRPHGQGLQLNVFSSPSLLVHHVNVMIIWGAIQYDVKIKLHI